MNPISQNHDFLCKIYSPTHDSTSISPNINVHSGHKIVCITPLWGQIHHFLAKKRSFFRAKRVFLAILCSFDTSSPAYVNEHFTKGFPAMHWSGRNKATKKMQKIFNPILILGGALNAIPY